MNRRIKLVFAVILWLMLWVVLTAAFRKQQRSARETDSTNIESNFLGKPTELTTAERSQIGFLRPEDPPNASGQVPERVDGKSTKSELELYLTESKRRLSLIEERAYLANPYLKVWEDYRDAPRNWADKDQAARDARLFATTFSSSTDDVKKQKLKLARELNNLMLPLLIPKIDSTDPQFRDLLSGTFNFYAKPYMNFLKAGTDKEIPKTLDEFILTVKNSTPVQIEAIEKLRIELGMSPEILEGIERGEMGRLLTGLVDIYLGEHTPQELGDAREAVRRAEILLGRKSQP